jgi:hypothetical protein
VGPSAVGCTIEQRACKAMRLPGFWAKSWFGARPAMPVSRAGDARIAFDVGNHSGLVKMAQNLPTT